mmetsp:Transcript_1282/g.3656  ORF Transcript_1282/g.3656 Transcript_1282/m.3656 type:complete len:359 (+) Transcript_1282:873-1949(+)
MSTEKKSSMTKSMKRRTGSASAARLKAFSSKWNFSNLRRSFMILRIGTAHRRSPTSQLTTLVSTSTGPRAARRARGAAEARSIRLWTSSQNVRWFGQVTSRTRNSSKKMLSMVISRTAAGTPWSGGGLMVCRSVTQTVRMTYAGISRAHQRATTCESGSSSQLQTVAKILRRRRWKRFRISAFSISFLDSSLLLRSSPGDRALLASDLRPPPRELIERTVSKEPLLGGGGSAEPGMTCSRSFFSKAWLRSLSSLEPSGVWHSTAPSALEGVLMLEADMQDTLLMALLKAAVDFSASPTLLVRLGLLTLLTLPSLILRFGPAGPAGGARSPMRERSWSRCLRMSASSGRTSCSNQEMRG